MSVMPAKRKGVCAVVFRRKAGKLQFLMLHRILHWKGWEFPKGGSSKRETLLKTLKRELKEEIGLKENQIEKVKKIPARQVFYDSIRKKIHDNQAFLVQVQANAKINLSKNSDKEHSSFKWLSAKKALALLTWKDQKKVFRRAIKLI